MTRNCVQRFGFRNYHYKCRNEISSGSPSLSGLAALLDPANWSFQMNLKWIPRIKGVYSSTQRGKSIANVNILLPVINVTCLLFFRIFARNMNEMRDRKSLCLHRASRLRVIVICSTRKTVEIGNRAKKKKQSTIKVIPTRREQKKNWTKRRKRS